MGGDRAVKGAGIVKLSAPAKLRKSGHKIAQKRVQEFCLVGRSVIYPLTHTGEKWVKET